LILTKSLSNKLESLKVREEETEGIVIIEQTSKIDGKAVRQKERKGACKRDEEKETRLCVVVI
jgi:hypothetical protein